MRVDELRQALADEAAAQPPVSRDARQALDRRIRQQRLRRVGLLGVPALVVTGLAVWALVATGSGPTKVHTAAPGPGGVHRLFSRTTRQGIGIEVDRGII